MSLGINNYIWNSPYMWNTSTAYGNQFDFSNNNLWTIPTFGSTNSSSKSDVDYENKYMIKSDSAQNPQLLELKQKKLKELKVEETQNALEETRAQVVKSKKADGSSSTRTPHKKMGFWGKVGRWLSNTGSAVVNIGKNFIGFEKDGSWNWKKCLTNVAITAAAVGACFIPVVGPAIGYGLAAFGVVTGGIGVAKGVSNLNKASSNDDEAIDNAQQEIVTGAITAITSAIGLRGIGKAASNASMAAERTSAAGKAWQNVSQFGRDITVNAIKATGEAMKADKALIAAQNGGKFTSFFKAWGSKMSGSAKGATEIENAYQKQHNEINKNINDRLIKIDNKIKELQEWQKLNGKLSQNDKQYLATLKEEKFLLERNKAEMSNFFGNQVKEKSVYDNLRENNSGAKAITRMENRSISANPNKIQGQTLSDKQLATFYSAIKKQQKAYNKALNKLIDTQARVMKKLAEKPNQNLSKLNSYVPHREKLTTWQKLNKKNPYQVAIGSTKQNSYGSLIKYTTIHPATTVPKANAIFNPIYTTPFGFGEEISSDQYDAALENLDAQIKMYEQLEEKINNCKNIEELEALTKTVENNTENEENLEHLTDLSTNKTENKEET